MAGGEAIRLTEFECALDAMITQEQLDQAYSVKDAVLLDVSFGKLNLPAVSSHSLALLLTGLDTSCNFRTVRYFQSDVLRSTDKRKVSKLLCHKQYQ